MEGGCNVYALFAMNQIQDSRISSPDKYKLNSQ